MPRRFYFDVEDGQGTIRDEDGVDANDLDEALADARSVIRDMADELATTGLSGASVLVIRDGTGAAVARLPIETSLSSILRRPPERRDSIRAAEERPAQKNAARAKRKVHRRAA